MKKLFAILCVLAMLCMLCVPVMAAGTIKLYCAAPSGWTNCNIYAWNDGGNNANWPGVPMTKGADGIWYAEIDSSFTKVIFNNGSGQSADLDIPTDNKVQFNYDAKKWVTYGSKVEVVETVYYLRGTMNEWGTSNPMTKNSDGTYSVTIKLAAGTYEYKAGIEDWSWSCPDQNLTMTLDSESKITFTLDLAANTLTATGKGIEEPAPVKYDYYVAGDEALCGENWNPGANKMTKKSGIYKKTFSNVAGGTYEFKIATGNWDSPNFGIDGNNCKIEVAVKSDVTITFDPDTAEIKWTITPQEPEVTVPTEPSEEETTAPTEAETTAPAEDETTEPTEPSEEETTAPADDVTSEPTEPSEEETTAPAEDETTESTEPSEEETTAPAEDETTESTEPSEEETTAPAEDETTESTEPADDETTEATDPKEDETTESSEVTIPTISPEELAKQEAARIATRNKTLVILGISLLVIIGIACLLSIPKKLV